MPPTQVIGVSRTQLKRTTVLNAGVKNRHGKNAVLHNTIRAWGEGIGKRLFCITQSTLAVSPEPREGVMLPSTTQSKHTGKCRSKEQEMSTSLRHSNAETSVE